MADEHVQWVSIYVTIALAVSQFVIAFIAVFHSWIQSRLRRPKIRVTFPVASQIYQSNSPNVRDNFWVRLAVSNDGKSIARGVTVQLESISNIEGHNVELIPHFFSSCLTWTHQNRSQTALDIVPGLPRFVDVIHCHQLGSGDGVCMLQNQIADSLHTPLNRGRWVLNIVVAGENFRPVYLRFHVSWDGIYSTNKRELLDMHLQIQLENSRYQDFPKLLT